MQPYSTLSDAALSHTSVLHVYSVCVVSTRWQDWPQTAMMMTFTKHSLTRGVRACALNWRSRWCTCNVLACWTCAMNTWMTYCYLHVHTYMHTYIHCTCTCTYIVGTANLLYMYVSLVFGARSRSPWIIQQYLQPVWNQYFFAEFNGFVMLTSLSFA